MSSSSYEELRNYWNKRQQKDAQDLFVDPEFPPTLKSLVNVESHKCRSSIHDDIRRGNVTWKRPKDICSLSGKKPVFVSKGTSTFDLTQGEIGNCWFVAGVTHLALRPEPFKRVVPDDQDFDENYGGIFHFYFWQYGSWKEVIIDDYLPYDNTKDCLFSIWNPREPDEFWAALMEKAYAKLNGCYENLDGGLTDDAMVDISGGIGHYTEIKPGSIDSNFFNFLEKSNRMNTLMACCIYTCTRYEEIRPDGLVATHAYCILDVRKVTDRNGTVHQLLRLRNPWSSGEWNGDWSDNSRTWSLLTPEQRKDMLDNKDDGQFWMNYDDWLSAFEEIQMCFIPPEVETPGKIAWNEETHEGMWVRGISAGGANPARQGYWTNPQIVITVTDPDPDTQDYCTTIIALMKKNLRKLTKNFDVLPINFDIYKLLDNKTDSVTHSTYTKRVKFVTSALSTAAVRRELSIRIRLDPGSYVIIPYTQLSNIEAQFILRVYTETPVQKGSLDAETGPVLKPDVSTDNVSRIYKKHCGSDDVLDASDLKDFLNEYFHPEVYTASSSSFELEASRELLRMFDKNKTGKLDFDETSRMVKELTVWKSVFRQYDNNNSNSIDFKELQTVFKKIGFAVSQTLLEIVVIRYGGKENQMTFSTFVVVFAKLTTYFHVYQTYKSTSMLGDGVTLDKFLREVI